MQKLITSIKIFLVFTILLGLAYPILIMVLGQLIFPHQANGSLLTANGKVIGSFLIAQEFTAPKYFHSRFSAVDYNAMSSGGSNLALSNALLYKQIATRINTVRLENNLPIDAKLPTDMVLSSASGLDPHISLTNAMLQLPRVAEYRGLPKETIKKMVYNCTNENFFELWGQKAVNVLQLNLALDKVTEQ